MSEKPENSKNMSNEIGIISKELLNSPFIRAGKPSFLIEKLFRLLNFPCNNNIDEFYKISQKYFLRSKNQQRWEIGFSSLDNLEPDIKPLLTEFGFINAVLPNKRMPFKIPPSQLRSI